MFVNLFQIIKCIKSYELALMKCNYKELSKNFNAESSFYYMFPYFVCVFRKHLIWHQQ